ncbi:MAG TPA: hypothetical protein PK767_10575, partial [Clostridiales bacterium]|nr:hypothetical protein [Clostridiales bacterium]
EVEIKVTGREAAESRRLLVVTQLDKIPVKGLPQNIPEYLEIDVAKLNADDKITVGDVRYPEGIVPDCDTEKIVLVITEAKSGAAAESQEGQEEQEDQKAAE